MQLYFIKATYTNNVYKLSDFFVGVNYNLIATKMLDINFRPDDGITDFITKNVILPDSSKLWEHTHVIIPEYEKIYRISSIDYLNNEQYRVILDEDPLIANYQALKGEDVILMRNNDPVYFRGVNDINDITIKETIETTVIPSTYKTGKWMLIFMQVNADKERYGLKFKNVSATAGYYSYEQYVDIPALIAKYPEVTTTTPNLYDYYQKIVRVGAGIGSLYQCVYNGDGTNTKLLWVEKNSVAQSEGDIYFNLNVSTSTKLNSSDIRNIIVALPFEFDFKAVSTDLSTLRLLHADSFVAPIDSGEVIDIKIVDDIMLPITGVTYDFWNGSDPRQLFKTVSSDRGIAVRIYDVATGGTALAFNSLYMFYDFKKEIDITKNYRSTLSPLDAEPFKKYELYIQGKKFPIPYYMTDNIKLLIVVNSGVINYLIYHSDKRYILASGSFTHSMKYQVDKIDQFYNQNPTYKEQFFTKMAIDSIKTIAGGAIGGSVVPGLGTLGGLGAGILGAGVDAGISMINFGFMEKGLKLMPDQIFGENSELGLQLLNIFGIYWVKKTSENADYMKVEYDLKGFPITKVMKINDLDTASSMFGQSKVVYAELKKVIKNNFVTGYINQKLKEGIVII
jgi:hypothetical protein